MSFPSNADSSNAAALFEKWNREKQAFEQRAAKSDVERTRLEARLRQLHATKSKLLEETRVASDALGKIHRERTMLAREKDRLKSVLANETRSAMDQCQAEWDHLTTAETQRKQSFCKEMRTLNKELVQLLMKHEDLRLQRLISVESTPFLLQALEKNQANCSPESMDSNSGAMLEDLRAAMELLKAATDQYDVDLAEQRALQKAIEQVRARALDAPASIKSKMQQPPPTEATLLELERVWGQQDGSVVPPDENALPGAGDPVHLQLFYNNNGGGDGGDGEDDTATTTPMAE